MNDSTTHPETDPDLGEPGLSPLVEALAEADGPADDAGGWPADLWTRLEAAGVTRWSLPREFGGEECVGFQRVRGNFDDDVHIQPPDTGGIRAISSACVKRASLPTNSPLRARRTRD